jgi:hypothetical protein
MTPGGVSPPAARSTQHQTPQHPRLGRQHNTVSTDHSIASLDSDCVRYAQRPPAHQAGMTHCHRGALEQAQHACIADAECTYRLADLRLGVACGHSCTNASIREPCTGTGGPRRTQGSCQAHAAEPTAAAACQSTPQPMSCRLQACLPCLYLLPTLYSAHYLHPRRLPQGSIEDAPPCQHGAW